MQRFRWGSMVHSEASRFIDEINPKFLDFQVKMAKQDHEPISTATYTSPKPIRPSPPPVSYQPSADFAPEDVSGLQPDMEVEHNRFGKGKVISVEGKGDDKKALIMFGDIGEKQILIKYAKMKILN